jgi:protein transport protein SEC23
VGALLVRQAVSKADGGASAPEMLKWIDKLLIRMMRSLCTYSKSNPGSVMLPREAGILPGLVFHMRRSAVLRTSGLSPDRTTFFRLLASTLDTFSSLVLVQPTLIGYQLGGGSGRPLPLEPNSVAPDRVLLLDSFTQLVLCQGGALAMAARDAGSPAANEVEMLTRRVRADAEALGANRFPAPALIECEQGSSKARYLTQKVNPDVPLSTFLQGLYRAIVE